MQENNNTNLKNDDDEKLLVIDHNLILPMCKKRFCYKKTIFPKIVIDFMLNHPSEKLTCLVKGKENTIAVKINISNIAIGKNLDDVGAIYLDVTGIKRVSTSPVTIVKGFKYASISANIEYSMEKNERINKIVSEIKNKINFTKKNLSSLQSLSNSQFIDFILFYSYTNKNISEELKDEFVSKSIETISVEARVKKIQNLLNIPEEKTDKITLQKNSDVIKNEKIKSKNKKVQSLIKLFYETETRMNEEARKKIFSNLESLANLNATDSEYKKILDYVTFGLELPWNKNSEDNEMSFVEKEINITHYGMEKVKERILEYLIISKLNPDANGTTILLNGPPGTGKTTLAQSIAKAMGRKHARISMGSCTKPEDITGFLRTYVGSAPGKIAKAIHGCGTNNPVIILDEIEKMGFGSNYDPSAVLLQLLDPNQNRCFQDIYLEYGINLKNVLFICTSNNLRELLPAVLDRMEVIHVKGYSLREKILIAKDYIIPKEAKGIGILETVIPDNIIKHLVNGYTRESGIRGLEKSLKSILTKIAVEKVNGNKITVTKNLIKKRLGLPFVEEMSYIPKMGKLVNGMAFTHSGMGGMLLPIEGLKLKEKGSGKLIITGRAGSIMLETMKVMRSYVSVVADNFGFEGSSLMSMDIHIHIPDASTKKDGPSASCAFALLLMSILSNKSVRKNLSITGEASLTGRVLPVGGLEEKCSAAIRAGITEIILPEMNRRNYMDFHKEIQTGAKYYFVNMLEDIFEIALNLKEKSFETSKDLVLLEETIEAR